MRNKKIKIGNCKVEEQELIPALTKTKIQGGETKKVVASKIETTTKNEIENGIDYYDLAYAVAMAETKNCQKGFGKEYNNCFGIKNGQTAPCPRIGRKNMCIYNSPSKSYAAFKKIWKKHYKKFPNYELAVRWTGNDRAVTWLADVRYYYNQRQNEKILK